GEGGEGGAPPPVVAALPVHDRVGYRWRRLVTLTMVAELAATLGDRERCARLHDELVPFADGIAVLGGAVFTTGPVAFHLGVLAAALDRWDDAVVHLQRAVALSDRLAARPYRARARTELARALLRRGRPGDRPAARDLLVAAIAEGDELGLAAVAERAAAELAELDRRRPVEQNVFRVDGDAWMLAFAGRTVRLRDAKGLRDLARLFRAPGQEIPATVLLHQGLMPASGAAPVLDERARAEYAARIAALDIQLADADAEGDPERSARLAAEREAVIGELARATGLRGRRRRLGDDAERARTTVTARIRDSIRHVERVHPELGHHLRLSVVTGTRCCYRPPEPVTWQL
ncbi:ABC transporter C-terminal domain-containing protein, partial [Pseudonocardia nigra]|uniref:ABC transporter C-terminal domain-containing protein n=1 Tax=Pseudonocardia nigra TaxID=1921578 RepID=UPI002484BC0A